MDPDTWYAQAVALCAQRNIMVGTGPDTFSPDQVLSQAECLVLALRLHDLMNGGNGVFDPAPEDWGKIALTLADGTELTSYGFAKAPLPGVEGAEFQFGWGNWRRTDNGHLYASLEMAPGVFWDEDPDAWQAANQKAEEWGTAHEGEATVKVGNMGIRGTVQCWLPLGNWILSFYPKDGNAIGGSDAIHDALYFGVPSPSLRWVWPAAWYRQQHGLTDMSNAFNSENASRAFFAYNLATAVGPLPALQTANIPDVNREESDGGDKIYNLYEAGVLTGVNGYGTFDPEGTLTRAEAAVMVARVLDESQRVTLTPYDAWRQAEATQGTVAGFYHRPFEELPQELRDSLTWDGQVETAEGFRFRLRRYTGPNIVITTTEATQEGLQNWLDWQMSLPEGDEAREGDDAALLAEYELETGREWLYSVTLTDDSYATALGLKAGHTVAEAEALGYPVGERLNEDGTATFGDTWEHSLTLQVEDGVVKELRLSWGLGRYTGKYWDL